MGKYAIYNGACRFPDIYDADDSGHALWLFAQDSECQREELGVGYVAEEVERPACGAYAVVGSSEDDEVIHHVEDRRDDAERLSRQWQGTRVQPCSLPLAEEFRSDVNNGWAEVDGVVCTRLEHEAWGAEVEAV